jgi:serine/threonine protein phosphatase PrpC
MADQCPACEAAVSPTDHFCEACGQDLTSTGPAAPAAPRMRYLTSADPPAVCPGCGGTAFGAEGYCDSCGQRRTAGKDHTELDLGVLAAVTDKGHRHHRNEDAIGIGGLGDTLVAIVCDGVSSSTRPDAASHGAVEAAMPALLDTLDGFDPADAIGTAAKAGQAAAVLAAGPDPGPNPPASTFVCAVVGPTAITVGWVGDSRAYWLPADGPAARLTVDDSMAGQAAAAGIELPAGLGKRQASALVRWMGADAVDTRPHVKTITPSGPGRVLVCSDGLFRYRPEADELAAATPAGPAMPTAQALVALALDAGGEDNIAVAVIPYPPTALPRQESS